MDILVVRHAIALDRDEAKNCGMLDRDRPLTREGRSRMKRAARGLAGRVPDVSALITSPLRRAVETAEILREQYKGLHHVETTSLLPEAEPAELVQFFADNDIASSTAMLVGHEPHLSGWVSWCLTGDARPALELRPILELRKGGACLLRFEDAPGPGKGRLLWLLTPAVLRRL
jgi:phosphohistidine phosphatase